jgi:hypothetical protein
MKKNYIKKTARLHTPGVLKTGKKLMTLGGVLIFSLLGIAAQNASYSTNNVPIAGTDCAAFGYQALNGNTTGSYNVGIGHKAMFSNTTGQYNTATGHRALYTNTTGSGNSANGMEVLFSNTTGYHNSGSGTRALYYNTTGYHNTGIGYYALYLNTTGYENLAVGSEALYSNTTGAGNSATGYQAMYSNTTSVSNTATGHQTMYKTTTGNSNAAFGARSLYNNTIGYWNTAVGYYAMYDNTEGYLNTAMGFNALQDNTIGDYNAGVGYAALYLNTDGRGNCGLGWYTLGTNTVGNYNSALGYGANVNANNYSNATAIGYNAIVTASNKIRLGDANVTVVEGPVAYTISDGRFKDNISETDVKGLEFIKLLRPVVYNFDSRRFEDFLTQNMPDSLRGQYMNQDFTGSTAIRQSGFIAQEVEDAAKESGYNFNGVHTPENENDNYSLAYAQFVVPLVKGMQEQQLMIEELQKQLLELQNQLASTHSINSAMDIILVYPNPGKGLVNITMPELKNGTVEVLTLEGRSIYNGVIMQGTTTYQLDLTAEAKGIYMVNIFSEGKAIASEKLIIE